MSMSNIKRGFMSYPPCPAQMWSSAYLGKVVEAAGHADGHEDQDEVPTQVDERREKHHRVSLFQRNCRAIVSEWRGRVT